MNEVMTDKQYGLLKKYKELSVSLSKEWNDEFANILDNYDITYSSDAVESIDIYEKITAYLNDELKDSAVITISNNHAIAIIETDGEFVFGYIPNENGNEYFLSEVFIDYSDDPIEGQTAFKVGNSEEAMILHLGNAMRI